MEVDFCNFTNKTEVLLLSKNKPLKQWVLTLHHKLKRGRHAAKLLTSVKRISVILVGDFQPFTKPIGQSSA